MTQERPIVLVIHRDARAQTVMAGELRACGCSAVAAAGADEAVKTLEAFAAHDAGIALVIADTRPPQLHGLQLLQRIRAVDLRVPVLLVTEASDITVTRHQALGVAGVLRLPFSADELSLLVRRAIHPAAIPRASHTGRVVVQRPGRRPRPAAAAAPVPVPGPGRPAGRGEPAQPAAAPSTSSRLPASMSSSPGAAPAFRTSVPPAAAPPTSSRPTVSMSSSPGAAPAFPVRVRPAAAPPASSRPRASMSSSAGAAPPFRAPVRRPAPTLLETVSVDDPSGLWHTRRATRGRARRRKTAVVLTMSVILFGSVAVPDWFEWRLPRSSSAASQQEATLVAVPFASLIGVVGMMPDLRGTSPLAAAPDAEPTP